MYTKIINDSMTYYRESSDNKEKSNVMIRSLMNSISNIILKDKDKISKSSINKAKGDVDAYKGVEHILEAADILKKETKHPKAKSIANDIEGVIDSLRKNKAHYMDAYNKSIEVVQYEFVSALYIAEHCASYGLAIFGYNDTKEYDEGSDKEGLIHKGNFSFDLLGKTNKEIGSKSHTEYLSTIDKVSDDLKFTEFWDEIDTVFRISTKIFAAVAFGVGRSVSIAVSLVKNIIKSIFGILPLTRNIIYLFYKRKADTIISLESQIEFIRRNIDQLKHKKGGEMSESQKATIIQKQEMKIKEHMRKIAKLKAELGVAEQEAERDIVAEDDKTKNAPTTNSSGNNADKDTTSTSVDNGDFVLD